MILLWCSFQDNTIATKYENHAGSSVARNFREGIIPNCFPSSATAVRLQIIFALLYSIVISPELVLFTQTIYKFKRLILRFFTDASERPLVMVLSL